MSKEFTEFTPRLIEDSISLLSYAYRSRIKVGKLADGVSVVEMNPTKTNAYICYFENLENCGRCTIKKCPSNNNPNKKEG
jgi:cobalamin biosynthesis protein CbiD